MVNGVWIIHNEEAEGDPDELMLNYGYIDDDSGVYQSQRWISDNKISRENYQWIGASFCDSKTVLCFGNFVVSNYVSTTCQTWEIDSDYGGPDMWTDRGDYP